MTKPRLMFPYFHDCNIYVDGSTSCYGLRVDCCPKWHPCGESRLLKCIKPNRARARSGSFGDRKRILREMLVP